jgi:hypothetical protein
MENNNNNNNNTNIKHDNNINNIYDNNYHNITDLILLSLTETFVTLSGAMTVKVEPAINFFEITIYIIHILLLYI